jgi:hypothetical protein
LKIVTLVLFASILAYSIWLVYANIFFLKDANNTMQYFLPQMKGNLVLYVLFSLLLAIGSWGYAYSVRFEGNKVRKKKKGNNFFILLWLLGIILYILVCVSLDLDLGLAYHYEFPHDGKSGQEFYHFLDRLVCNNHYIVSIFCVCVISLFLSRHSENWTVKISVAAVILFIVCSVGITYNTIMVRKNFPVDQREVMFYSTPFTSVLSSIILHDIVSFLTIFGELLLGRYMRWKCQPV